MAWRRGRYGLALPRHRGGLCSLFGGTHLVGFGAHGDRPPVQPLWNSADKDSGCTLSDGDRTATQAANNAGGVRSTSYQSTGKWYVEIFITSANSFRAGIANSSYSVANAPGDNNTAWVLRGGDGTKYFNGTGSACLPTFSVNDVLQIAVDADAAKVWFGRNGTWSGDPGAGTGEAFSGIAASVALVFGAPSQTSNKTGTLTEPVNYAHTTPAGFLAGWG